MTTTRPVCFLAALLVSSCAESQQQANPPTVTAASALSVPAIPTTTTNVAQGAVMFEGLGNLHRGVTASPEAQRWFDQGLRLTYAFNHDEAARSFARGAEIDPSCAMCFWGVALALGPNYNAPLFSDR